MAVQRVEIESTAAAGDALAAQTLQRLEAWLGLVPARLRTRKVFHLELGLNDEEAGQVARALIDPVAEVGVLGRLPDEGCELALSVGFRPGVTDCVGKSVRRAAGDCLGRELEGNAYSSVLYLFAGIERSELERAARALLFNPLIEWMRVEATPHALDLSIPQVGTEVDVTVAHVALRTASDAELERLCADGMLALTLAEMKAIAAYFGKCGRDPTDAELECLAQTWSEHCKHKIFASPIEYTAPDGNVESIDEGVFKRYIVGATQAVAQRRLQEGLDPADAPFLVSVFHDNAGVVRFSAQDHLVYKVETHNSPSALDPYGGAMTGIVGVNRDSFGTGLGADLLTNVWGYCFGDPRYDGKLPRGLMHPRRIRDGVHHGVIDGGNQSGIPYSRGFERFDDRYLGKPLVYCGTVAVMPAVTAGRQTHLKPVSVGDKVVMIGGRIGKDGIHGATFSSAELDENAPVQAVQIGDPLTQKMMFDMLAVARDQGLFSGMTDNGAGGLSSSIGEMAEFTGGASIDLADAPLKYPGLRPWEILISEAQERMSLAVRPVDLPAFMALARRYEVDATVLGEFTDSGRFEVTYGTQSVVDLPLGFLHDGWPRPRLIAKLDPPQRAQAGADELRSFAAAERCGQHILDLLGRPNLATPEGRARGYDHEVKGLSVIKPMLGARRDVPATATVMRARHGRDEGVVLAEGIHPYYADLHAGEMAKACVDEAVRRVLCAGARYDRIAALDNFCWPDPVQSKKTPDGAHKLAQLVQCCQGLREACEAYGVPLISGKDSMKNDAVLDGVKISIPPTLLVSAIAQMTDVSRALTLSPRAEGDVIWVLGETRDEMGASEVMRMGNLHSARVPQTDVVANAQRYTAFASALEQGLVRSAHVAGLGGLAVALAHMTMASQRVLSVDLAGQRDGFVELFSESTGRIVFTTCAADSSALQAVFAAATVSAALTSLGEVGAKVGAGRLLITKAGSPWLDMSGDELSTRFHDGLRDL